MAFEAKIFNCVASTLYHSVFLESRVFYLNNICLRGDNYKDK